MTTGEMIFYAGAALLALTVVLAVVFAVKKPVYRPESAAADDRSATQPLRNGYPTDPLTVRRERSATRETEVIDASQQTTELMDAPPTEYMTQPESPFEGEWK